ncbi:DUF6907 domain-containing protein [Streptomyces sp. NBC_01264]|uniref:DUF6907 domain-containing protein n=1 Tax=Streptomyces sp. NBC_01264 TaxID=2903804 RepID=UPI0022595602|nr:hypothetical protein [Streptomyces sp. NBC_01264]MCX4780126.1 hypothetical protein [Streptomyces sp. NBC_01264]
MSNTVPANLPRMFRPEPKLTAVPVQPTAKTRETLPAGPPARTWSFLDRTTGNMQDVTCLQGCVADHTLDMESPQHPHDIWCCTASRDVYLPIAESGKVEEFRVLSAFIRQEPFSRHLHERVPHAQVEIVDDHWMESLDPDGLATVILTLEAQLTRFREVHAQLVELREQGRVQL